MAHTTTLVSPNGRYVVEPGIVDDRALIAFTNGLCHNLASALAKVLGGGMVALRKSQDPFDHVLARAGDGRLIDIEGAHTPAELTVSGGQLIDVDVKTLEGMTAFNWSPLDPGAAAPWVPAVLRHVASGAPRTKPRCFVHDFHVDDLAVHVEWSAEGGAAHLSAFGQLPVTPPGSWPCGSIAWVPRDDTGARLINFLEEEFDWLAYAFEKSIRKDPSGLRRNVLDPTDPQRPLVPPGQP